jgi:hypothetical protein
VGRKELWLLLLRDKGSFHVWLLRFLASREKGSSWVLLSNGRDEFLSKVIGAGQEDPQATVTSTTTSNFAL